MSLNTAPSSPPKRPRLSLQIKTPAAPQVLGKSVTALKADIDPSSPTAFNTLSNAYAAAIENSSPKTSRPLSDFRTAKPTSLRLQTTNVNDADAGYVHPSQRTQTPGPFSITYPDTPTSAYPTTTSDEPETEGGLKPIASATSFTFTPPQSAGSEQTGLRVFTFSANAPSKSSPSTPRTPRRRMTVGSQYQIAPYTHPRSLHSILRNSPLPPRATATPATPSRMSMRIANRAAKKVGYNDPLEQTITTNKYVRSHIDLLAEESPYSAIDPEAEKLGILDPMVYTGDETRDGGQTPGPFEEMRRRMAESELETPGARKRKRREKKRKWEWTITNAETEGEEEKEVIGRTPLTAVMLADTPITAIRRGSSVSGGEDSEMSEAEERYVPSVSEDSEMSEREDWGGSDFPQERSSTASTEFKIHTSRFSSQELDTESDFLEERRVSNAISDVICLGSGKFLRYLVLGPVFPLAKQK
ncbi:uncharacterized protein LY89DRAFT_746513 [Mollisia scopiformis]|uniref:Uncharacterized protein n=1 Tax=Mollisia scopiformis TaxID=149040 RepID=A0A194XDK1_MOLSC|nr:uncharacterized protein LY89DRAFT_746513 [Mollisia scopiformis]KUJ18253.1 hypothetical protein LY89DRAFT_746513 [Mollisia scopiformis]